MQVNKTTYFVSDDDIDFSGDNSGVNRGDIPK